MLPGTNSSIREPVFNEPSNNSIFTNRKTVPLDETKASTTSLIFSHKVALSRDVDHVINLRNTIMSCVTLTIVTTSNPHTLYFDHPIEKPSYIRLLSTSLYNSWNNLKEEAVISVADPNGTTAKANLLPGHYTIDVLVNEFNNLNKTNLKFVLNAVANTPVSSMTIFTQNNVTSVRTAWD